MARICISWLFALLMAAGLTRVADAQSRATGADLTGIVMDQTEGILSGATVTVTQVDTSIPRTVAVQPDGRFAILALAPGLYRLRAESPGFRPQIVEGLRLELGAVVDLKVTLLVGGPQEQITVTSASPPVDRQETAVSHVVGQSQIDSLPIDRRSFIGFTLVTPGVSADRIPQPSQGATPTSGLTFAGQRPRANNVLVDGFDNNSAASGAVRATISQEAVSEFQVLANSYSAEFGNASGGIVNIVTRSGGNSLRGDAFLFGRDDALSAKAHFEKFDPSGNAIDRPKAPFNQKQYGGVLGGPVRRDKTFYFLSFERLDTTAANFVTIDDGTAVIDPLSGQRLGTPAEILRRAGFAVETGNVPYAVRSSQFLVKMDHQFNDRQRLGLRFNRANSLDENTEVFGGQTARSRAGALSSADDDVAASHAWVTDRAVNELRIQWADRDQALKSLDSTCGGACDRDDQGGPTLEVVGVGNVGRQRTTPLLRETVLYEARDTFSFLRGAHQFKSGAEFKYLDNPQYHLPLTFGGRYVFTALPAIPGLLPVPISAIQAVALGLPAAYVQGYGNPDGHFASQGLSLFAEDDVRLKPNVTLKYGVRYQKQFWPRLSYNVPGFPGAYTFPSDNNNVAPRVAVAWTPKGNGITSVHGAYGIYYADLITAVAGITNVLNGDAGVRTLALRVPRSIAAWNAPGRRLPEAAAGAFPSVRFTVDPALETPSARHASIGVDRRLGRTLAVSADFVYVRGVNEIGTLDYNPLVPALGAGRRPEDVDGVAGTSASILQYTSFGESWYRGLTLSINGRFTNRYQLLASYTLSKATDNSTDFQSAFVVQDTGRGRDRNNPAGLPVGFDPDAENATSLQDQRHRLVVSGIAQLPANFQLSGILTVASGWPFNILAGADLNGDGDGGAFPSDRARRNPADASTSIPRNSGRLPPQATLDLRIRRRFGLSGPRSVDAIVEVFNLFNRTNFTDVNNIFGSGAYPSQPAPTFGLFQQAAAPRQLQVAVRVNF